MATKEEQVLAFLSENVFDPILRSDSASERLKQGVRYTLMRLKERDAAGMVSYYVTARARTS